MYPADHCFLFGVVIVLFALVTQFSARQTARQQPRHSLSYWCSLSFAKKYFGNRFDLLFDEAVGSVKKFGSILTSISTVNRSLFMIEECERIIHKDADHLINPLTAEFSVVVSQIKFKGDQT